MSEIEEQLRQTLRDCVEDMRSEGTTDDKIRKVLQERFDEAREEEEQARASRPSEQAIGAVKERTRTMVEDVLRDR